MLQTGFQIAAICSPFTHLASILEHWKQPVNVTYYKIVRACREDRGPKRDKASPFLSSEPAESARSFSPNRQSLLRLVRFIKSLISSIAREKGRINIQITNNIEFWRKHRSAQWLRHGRYQRDCLERKFACPETYGGILGCGCQSEACHERNDAYDCALANVDNSSILCLFLTRFDVSCV